MGWLAGFGNLKFRDLPLSVRSDPSYNVIGLDERLVGLTRWCEPAAMVQCENGVILMGEEICEYFSRRIVCPHEPTLFCLKPILHGMISLWKSMRKFMSYASSFSCTPVIRRCERVHWKPSIRSLPGGIASV